MLRNASELGIDLSDVTDLVITHNHADHTGGLVTLRRELAKKNARALSRAHVARGIFDRRPRADGSDGNGLLPLKAGVRSARRPIHRTCRPDPAPSRQCGSPGLFRVSMPNAIGVAAGRVQTAGGLVEDTIAEDASVIVDTADGLIVVSGCGHAGMINTIEYARKVVRETPVLAAVGGFHLFAANDATLESTGNKLKAFGLRYLLGAHCTGLEAVYRLRAMLGLTRRRRRSRGGRIELHVGHRYQRTNPGRVTQSAERSLTAHAPDGADENRAPLVMRRRYTEWSIAPQVLETKT